MSARRLLFLIPTICISIEIACGTDAPTFPPSPSGATSDGGTFSTFTSERDAAPPAKGQEDAAADASDAAPDGTVPTSACTRTDDCVHGSCFEGVCICEAGAFMQPDGTCGPTPLGVCADQGGACVQHTGLCPAGETPGSATASKTCGDFVAAVCCFECKGPTDFVCCNDAHEVSAAFCAAGWMTCDPGSTARQGSITDADICN